MNASTSPAGSSLPPSPLVRMDAAGASFTVRGYEAPDHDALERFYREFEPKRAAQGLPPAGDARVRSWLGGVLDSGLHLLAFRGPVLIGHAFVVPADQPQVGEYAIFLREEERGRGVGTDLSRVAVESARGAGFRKLWLTVEPGNRAAVRAYQNVGFRFVPTTRLLLEAEMELPL